MDYRYLGTYLLPAEMIAEGVDMILAELFLEKYTAATGMTREEILSWLPLNAAALYGFVQDEGMNQDLHAIIREGVE